MTPPQLEKQYQDWILEMHDRYDEEVDSGEDQPTLVVIPEKNKKLGISSDGTLDKKNLIAALYPVIT